MMIGLSPVVLALCGVFGLLIGSFLNVVVYRVPLGMSLSQPPSACPQCKNGIKAYDNVPVLSWAILRGRCRNCALPISARYPLVELGTAIFFLVVGLFFADAISSSESGRLAASNTLTLVAFLYLGAITVALGLIDLDTRTLPNRIVLPSYIVAAMLLSAAAILANSYEPLIRGGIGLAALWAAYAVIAIVKPGGMGFGDVKLAGVLGLFLGWSGWGALIVGSFAAFLLGGVFGIALILARKSGRKSAIPFGPWMLAGAWVGIFFGNQIWDGYLSLFGLTA